MIKKTLYFGNPAYLSLKNNQLVLRLPEVEKNDSLPEQMKSDLIRTIPIEDIGIVVLDCNQITITQGLMEKLLENNCSIVSCDKSHLPVGLFLPLCSNTVQSKRFQEQISASMPLMKQMWQQTIQAKIQNQANTLASCRPDSIVRNMKVWATNVKSGDSENMEARAAAYYWKNLFPEYPDFTRGREDAPPNNLLNYGYAILRAIVARGLVCSGLLPTFGIHHHNKYNAYCLADDIMEPYRPYVDKIVVDIVKRGVNISELNKELKVEFLRIPLLDTVINGQTSPLINAVTTTTASLAKCFSGELRKIVYPEIQETY